MIAVNTLRYKGKRRMGRRKIHTQLEKAVVTLAQATKSSSLKASEEEGRNGCKNLQANNCW